MAGSTHSHGQSASGGNLDNPLGIYVNATTRDIFIADNGYSRVQEWSEPYTTGVTVAGTSQQPGSTNSLLSGPCGVWQDAYGNILVTDYSNNRIMEWAPGADSGIEVIGYGDTASYITNALGDPYGICLDGSNNLYVTNNSYADAKEFTGYYTGVKTVNSPLISSVSLYPNPNIGSFTLHGSADASLNGKDAYIVIMDMSGRVVMSQAVTVQNGSVDKQIDMGTKIPNGAYQLQLVSGNSRAGSKFEIIR